MSPHTATPTTAYSHLHYISGDLIKLSLAGHFDLIAHGANCFHTMNAGIAKQIRLTFPQAYIADLATIKGDRAKLGTFSAASTRIQHNRPLTILNCYTQYHFGRATPTRPHADYEAIMRCMRSINQHFDGLHLGIPLIGAGLAGGKWPLIYQIIADNTAALRVTIVTLPQTNQL